LKALKEEEKRRGWEERKGKEREGGKRRKLRYDMKVMIELCSP
jgi:hypothetical protein